MIRGAGTVFIERERPRDACRVNRKMASVLASGDVIAIFPEGTCGYGDDVLPFKSALLQPIVDAQGKVQPVAIRYRTPDGELAMAPTYAGETSFVQSFWAVCSERALTVELVAMPALPARGHRRHLARAAEASIRTALVERASATEPGTRGGRQA
jgi:1-acyl-sn-glycerol-3-phosphate acyltransferase